MGDHADALRAEYDRHVMAGRKERAEQIKEELAGLGESLDAGQPEPSDEGSGHLGEVAAPEPGAPAAPAGPPETATAGGAPETTAAARASDAG